MAEQRARAKADAQARKVGVESDSVLRELRAVGETPFTGYDEIDTPTTVRGLIRDGLGVPAAREGETVEVVLDRTPFYAESGGQTADQGVITAGDARIRVTDVQKPVKGLIVHRGVVEAGELVVGAEALASVDPEWRTSARQAHSGTHVVHAALRQVLGPTALQSGSLNRPGYLRLTSPGDTRWTRALGRTSRMCPIRRCGVISPSR
jgi:alanyl-tRNA synthetase